MVNMANGRYAFTPDVSLSLFRLFANAHHSVDDQEHVKLAKFGY